MNLTSKNVKDIDKYCIEKLGIPEIILMENAALKVVENVDEKVNKIAVICGTGNNGGDGLAAGRHLLCKGKQIKFFIIGSKEKMSSASNIHFNILTNLKADVSFINNSNGLNNLKNYLGTCDMIIDSLFGIGLSREITGIYKQAIDMINNSSKYVLSVDTPSGLNANTGEICGCCVKASRTVTFIEKKQGFDTKEAKPYLGEIKIEQISVPKFVIDKII